MCVCVYAHTDRSHVPPSVSMPHFMSLFPEQPLTHANLCTTISSQNTLLSSYPSPIHYLRFARDLNAVENGSSFLIAFDNNFVKAPLAAGKEQSHQQL